MLNRIQLVSIAGAAALISACAAPPVEQEGGEPVLVIKGATLVDGTGADPQADSVVVIRGNRIEAVGTVRRNVHPIERRDRGRCREISDSWSHRGARPSHVDQRIRALRRAEEGRVGQ